MSRFQLPEQTCTSRQQYWCKTFDKFHVCFGSQILVKNIDNNIGRAVHLSRSHSPTDLDNRQTKIFHLRSLDSVFHSDSPRVHIVCFKIAKRQINQCYVRLVGRRGRESVANERMMNQMGRGATAAALFSLSFQKEQVWRAILCLDLPSDSQVVFLFGFDLLPPTTKSCFRDRC